MKLNKHMLLMFAGCGAMIVGLVLLPLLGVKLGGVLPILLALACPLSMVFMMGGMHKGHDHSGHGHDPRGEEEGHASCHGETEPRSVSQPRALPAPAPGKNE